MSETPAEKKSRKVAKEVAFVSVAGAWEPKKTGAARGTRPRSEYMQQLDALIKGAYNGDPVFLEVDATEEAVTDIEKKVRSSAEYVQLGVRFGEEQASQNKGKIVVCFKVVDKRVYKKASE